MKSKDPAAVALGRRGGLAKNKKLTKKQRKQIGKVLVLARQAKRRQSISHDA